MIVQSCHLGESPYLCEQIWAARFFCFSATERLEGVYGAGAERELVITFKVRSQATPQRAVLNVAADLSPYQHQKVKLLTCGAYGHLLSQARTLPPPVGLRPF